MKSGIPFIVLTMVSEKKGFTNYQGFQNPYHTCFVSEHRRSSNFSFFYSQKMCRRTFMTDKFMYDIVVNNFAF